MAEAAIKMDELLVSWLGSDVVYEDVLNRIETLSADAAAAMNSISPPPSPSRRPAEEEEDFDVASFEGTSVPEKDMLVLEDGANTSPRGVVGVGTIPPFYRPPGTLTDDGKKAAPIRRNRDDGFTNDQSWDGTFQMQGNARAAPSLAEKIKADADANAGADANDDATNIDADSGKNSEGEPAGANSTAGASSTQTTTPSLPIKDQVTAIYEEMGKLQSAQGDDRKKDQLLSAKYLTIDNFVKITKDICNFPTFFNGPLYKRILYLWNIRDKESLEERLELWKEYYDNEDNTLSKVLGVEPNSSSSPPSPTADETEKEEGKGETEEKTEEDNAVFDDGRYGTMLITYDIFRWFWIKEMEDFDLSERFFRLVKKPQETFIGRDDFSPFIKELLRDHPGLEFLSNHAEFQDKYAVTVITRIFYSVNKCHSGRITSRQIRRSDLLSAFQQVDEEEDINKVTRYFSYEHFYVLYCRFWELDHDRDYKITREDLLKYGEQCLSHMIVDRIFDAAPKPFEGETIIEEPKENEEKDDTAAVDKTGKDGAKDNREYLTYEDFIFFMLSEEDKANEISVRYWFACIDVDGDGKLNNMEMRSFYALQQHRMSSFGHEHIPFEDMLCQMIDMIKPANEDYLVVEDFLQPECAAVSGALFDALFNLSKYMQFEQRDPFQERQKREDEFETDWDRFACMDYNRLALEEEAREEDAMEIDWVTVEDDDEEGSDEYNLGVGGASEAPF